MLTLELGDSGGRVPPPAEIHSPISGPGAVSRPEPSPYAAAACHDVDHME